MKKRNGMLVASFLFTVLLSTMPTWAAGGHNLALRTNGALAEGDSYYVGAYWFSEPLLIDGFRDNNGFKYTCWASEETPDPHWIKVRFPQEYNINRVRIYWAKYSNRFWTSRHFFIQSWDGKGWKNVLEVKNNKMVAFTEHVFSPVRTSLIRIWQPVSGGSPPRVNLMWVGEVEVYAPGDEPPEVVKVPLRSDQMIPLQIPLEQKEKVFYSKDNRANFTFFDGVKNVTVENGKLKFVLTRQKAMLGWGNYQGKQPVSEVADMFEEVNNVRIRVKQSAPGSKWTLQYWADGKKRLAPVRATLVGTSWKELAFSSCLLVPTPDGLGIEIEAQKGTKFEIEYVKLVQPRYEGYFRKEFSLPKEKIWRAIADVGGPPRMSFIDYSAKETKIVSTLYINGKEVKRRGARLLGHTAPVDIAPYLRPGKNCVAFYGYRVWDCPAIMLQSKIILTSGKVVNWRTDTSWKYSGIAKKGWNAVGYDDSSWATANISTLYMLSAVAKATDGSLAIPAYKGCLVIKNPRKKDLFYVEGSDIALDVYIPEGLEGQSPIVEYVFSRADSTGKSTLVKRGDVSSFEKKGSSMVYRINEGKHPKGVYTIELTLRGRRGVIAERPREPLMVVRRFSLKEIEGKDYREGLDLELEDTIDFTDPNDLHPWVESKPAGYRKPTIGITTPSIVRNNGLVYRETSSERGAFFGYRFQFKHPGSLYLLELEYPDDAQREIEVSISDKTDRHSQSGVGAETGGKFYLTGKMQTLSWIHVADHGVHSVNIICLTPGRRAAAKSFKVYLIKGELPSVGTGSQRLFGIHTERCYERNGFAQNLGVDRRPVFGQEERPEAAQPSLMERFIQDLVWMQETVDRYVQYLKFAGQNTHIIGCYQYYEYNTPFVHPYETDTARLPYCLRSILANVLDVNDISFYAGIQWKKFRNLNTVANNAQVARGKNTVWMIDGKGRQLYGNSMPNWLHHRNREGFRDLMREVADKFKDLPHFKGVHFLLGDAQGSPCYLPAFARYPNYDDPFRFSYDDISFAEFEKETGTRLDIGKHDPKRFEKRHALIQYPQLKQKFVSWRCRKVREFLDDGLRALKAKRRDLQFMSVYAAEDWRFFKYWTTTDKPFKEFLKDFALDLDLLKQTKDFWLGRWTTSWRSAGGKSRGGASQDPYCWIPKVEKEVTSAYDRKTNRYVLVRTSWDENYIAAPGYVRSKSRQSRLLVGSDWIQKHQGWIRALLQPSGYHAREAFIQALISSDPDALMYGFTDGNLNAGHEQEIREFARIFTHLPKEKFETVLDTGFATNFAIRTLSKGVQFYLYVANPGYWHINGTVSLNTRGTVYDLVSGNRVRIQKKGGNIIIPISLAPYGLVAYRVDSPLLKIESYMTSTISARELSHMQSIMQRVAKLLSDAETKPDNLLTADRKFLEDTLSKAQQALREQNYALAWSLLTHWRFWTLWKESLEPVSKR